MKILEKKTLAIRVKAPFSYFVEHLKRIQISLLPSDATISLENQGKKRTLKEQSKLCLTYLYFLI